MAYDANGNWYLDVNDVDDQEMVVDEARREVARNFVKNQQKAAKDQQDVNSIWHKTLQEENMDPTSYETLYNEDPELAKELMQTGMRHLAKGLKKGRDAKGRFTKQGGGPVPVGQRSHVETSRMEEIRQKAHSGKTLSDQDENELIDSLFPEGL